MFKTRCLYIRIRQDLIEVTDLDTNETVSKKAVQPFSGTRNIVGNFHNARETIALALSELGVKTGFFQPRLWILIQQLDGIEGGLSDIEKRALRDLGEMAGGNKVILLEQPETVSTAIALSFLKDHA